MHDRAANGREITGSECDRQPQAREGPTGDRKNEDSSETNENDGWPTLANPWATRSCRRRGKDWGGEKEGKRTAPYRKREMFG